MRSLLGFQSEVPSRIHEFDHERWSTNRPKCRSGLTSVERCGVCIGLSGACALFVWGGDVRIGWYRRQCRLWRGGVVDVARLTSRLHAHFVCHAASRMCARSLELFVPVVFAASSVAFDPALFSVLLSGGRSCTMKRFPRRGIRQGMRSMAYSFLFPSQICFAFTVSFFCLFPESCFSCFSRGAAE